MQAAMQTPIQDTSVQWEEVCHVSDLVPNSGVCALVRECEVALFTLSTADGLAVFGLSNYDPIGKANVMYRGLVGSIEDDVVIASPLYKQHYSLATGQCYEDDSVSLTTYPVKIDGERVYVCLSE